MRSETVQAAQPYPHYFKPLPPGCTHVDVYRVLHLFGVSDPALQHAVKKLLCAGARGAKDQAQDISEAIATLQRWQQMRQEEQPAPDLREAVAEIREIFGNDATAFDISNSPDVGTSQPAPAAAPEFIIAPIVCPGTPDAHTLTLKIGVQSFRICGGLDFHTRKDAEWMASQLYNALESMRQPIAGAHPAPAPEDAERAAYLKRWANAPEWAEKLQQFQGGNCMWTGGGWCGYAGENLLGSVRCEPRPTLEGGQGVGL